ncbi:MAG: AAA family ATPase, partial [Myxococcales bacterium]|nr:AAA family ATPase [Myxococcales bacterium]
MVATQPGIDGLLTTAKLIVCCGPGGVGKTTTAAAMALRAADEGLRSLVLTIDPARRLATCLGLDSLGGKPAPIEREGREGEMWATMLDTRGTFDDLVDRLSPDVATAKLIKSSRLYGIFAGSMHGTTEYMALESLYDAYVSGRFDVIVLDTPPLTNALDFFNVPDK